MYHLNLKSGSFNGVVISQQFAGKQLIGVAEKTLKKHGTLAVTLRGDTSNVMEIGLDTKYVTARKQKDKFSDSDFTLLYYVWKVGTLDEQVTKKSKFGDEEEWMDFTDPLINNGKTCRILKSMLHEWEKLASDKRKLEARK